MTRRRATALATVVLCATVLLARGATAQSVVSQPQRYMLSADALDGRALWLQPAGLSGRPEASLSGMFTMETGDAAVREYGVTLASRGLGVGWQHDRLPDGRSGDQWAVGFALGNPLIGLGVSRRWVRGAGSNGTATDAGFRYHPTPGLRLALGWHNIGSPVLRDTVALELLRPAAALLLFGGRVTLGAEVDVETGPWSSSAVRAGASLPLPLGLGLSLRADFDGSFSGQGGALALTWRRRTSRVSGYWADPGPGASTAGVWGSVVRDLAAPIRRR